MTNVRSLTSAIAASALLLALSVSTARASLIVNGDFEAGNIGFSSAYQYVMPGPGNLYPASVYTVDSNPNYSHNLFYSMGDHTTGSGNFMIINGSSVTGVPVWQGTSAIALVLGQQYDFSGWFASVHPASPASLTLMVGSTALGTFSPTIDGSWTRFASTFTATDVSPAFWLLNNNGEPHGNDFAIDDLDIFVPGTTVNPTPQVASVPDSALGLAAPIALVALCCGAAFKGLRKRAAK